MLTRRAGAPVEGREPPSLPPQVTAWLVWICVWVNFALEPGIRGYAVAAASVFTALVLLVHVPSVARRIPAIAGWVACWVVVLGVTLALVALAAFDLIPIVSPAAFVMLCGFTLVAIDWRERRRLRVAVVISLTPYLYGLRGTVAIHPQVLAMQVLLLLVTLALLERDREGTVPPLVSDPSPVRDRRELVMLARAVAVIAFAALVLNIAIAPPSRWRDPVDGEGEAGTSSSYAAFDDSMDTSERGKLGDETVLRVRADAPDFLRVKSYADFDGRVWTNIAAYPSPMETADEGWSWPRQRLFDSDPMAGVLPDEVPKAELVQDIIVVRPGDRAGVGAYSIDTVWNPDSDVLVDPLSSEVSTPARSIIG